ncbi:phosphatidylserine decarboxylase [Alphaproteobacteria bacterium]|jgi:phosphatidylserine decarboxylase|nr:phosphatidylserine decarboxylase [Alphaproteobacteria bacterium]MDB9871861.1 phosphatidylserine decarboxylase [Alphaproteobacteria bacterium]|tara:strand:- start:69 stop:785 length:717 start_codon:yes stop_codon:yes gene_type:complete
MSIIDSIKTSVLVPIHPAGTPFIAIFVILTAIIGWIWSPLYFVGFILTIWCIYFFRNPNRVTPILSGVNKNNLIIAPADGRIIEISKVIPDQELGLPDGDWQRICIFMNVFDVHVNRSPMLGKITYKNYIPGLFFNASLDKASSDNERLILGMDTENGKKIAFVQIAGLVARRIICDVDIGSSLKAGDVFGLIRFGSRVDVYFPSDTSVSVLLGQKTLAGETILADFSKNSKSVQSQI